MAQATFSTPSVSCMSCMAKIEGAVTSLDGVEDVDVDLVDHVVNVTFDDSRVDSQRLAQAITEAGYEIADAKS